jgi:hypothetical protein
MPRPVIGIDKHGAGAYERSQSTLMPRLPIHRAIESLAEGQRADRQRTGILK